MKNPSVYPFNLVVAPEDCSCPRCVAYRLACVKVERLLEGVRDGNIIMSEELLRDARDAVMQTVKASGMAQADLAHVPGRLWPCLWRDSK